MLKNLLCLNTDVAFRRLFFHNENFKGLITGHTVQWWTGVNLSDIAYFTEY